MHRRPVLLRLLLVLLAVLVLGAAPAQAAGTAVDVDGTLVVVHEDPLPGAPAASGYRYFLRTGGEHLELRFDRAPAFAPRQRLHVEGTRRGDRVTVAGARARGGAGGGRDLDGDAWYRETSYGAFGLTAKASPWLRIPQQADGCPIYDYAAAARTAAVAQGLDPDAYDHSVMRSAPGTYAVRLTKAGVVRGHVQVSGYGSDGNRCKVASFGRSGADQLVNVVCNTPAGIRADARFTINWVA